MTTITTATTTTATTAPPPQASDGSDAGGEDDGGAGVPPSAGLPEDGVFKAVEALKAIAEGCQAELKVSALKIPDIVGEYGAGIKQLEEKSGARIVVNRDISTVNITGHPEHVQAALVLVKAQMKKKAKKDKGTSGDDSGGGRDGGGVPAFDEEARKRKIEEEVAHYEASLKASEEELTVDAVGDKAKLKREELQVQLEADKTAAAMARRISNNAGEASKPRPDDQTALQEMGYTATPIGASTAAQRKEQQRQRQQQRQREIVARQRQQQGQVR
jgi:hypothetical protein